MTVASYLGLLGAAIALAIIPGPDTMLALRYALRGRGAGLLSALGSTTSMLLWGALAAIGVVAVLRASAIAYDLLTIAGGGYIVYLGVRLVVGAVTVFRTRTAAAGDGTVDAVEGDPEAGRTRRWLDFGGPYLAGALSTITNPKVGIFFLALFPEFVPAKASPWFVAGVLGGTCAACGLIYLLVIVFVADAMNRWLARPVVTAVIEGVSGLVLTALGLVVLIPAIIALASGAPAAP